jgi:NAD(P)-dependent dehydrogenase (short-subunit alcohol dehydrogenase family)
MSFELAPFGIGVKTLLPGGMNTDFFGSMEIVRQSCVRGKRRPHTVSLQRSTKRGGIFLRLIKSRRSSTKPRPMVRTN